MDSLMHDLRVSARALVRTPLATGLAVLSLALGIAVTTTVFAAVDGFVLRPLAAPRPHELMAVYATNPERGWTRSSLSLPNLLDFRRESRTLAIAGYASRDVNFRGQEDPEHLVAMTTTAGFFRVIGVAPALGREFLSREEQAGADKVALLGHGLWVRRFGGDPGVIGRTVRLDGVTHTVVGIVPKEIPIPFGLVDVWTPVAIHGDEPRDDRGWAAIGRLRDGASEDEARSELSTLAGRLEDAYPRANAGTGADVVSYRKDLYGDDPRTGSVTLLIAGLLVLLIACANVMNLLLARVLRRDRELAVRLALGARRRRIVQLLLTESIMMGLAGGALGALLSVGGVRALLAMLPPIFSEIIRMNGTVLAFATVLAAGAGVFVGIAPALQTSDAEGRGALVQRMREATSGRRRGRLRRALAVSQVALALVLLVTSGLLIQSLVAVRTVPLGFATDRVLTFSTRLPETTYPSDESVLEFQHQLLPQLAALPGVESAAAVSFAPLSNHNPTTTYAPEGQQYPEGREPVAAYRGVSPGYFVTMEVPVTRGRDIAATDGPGATPVVWVSESFVGQHWPEGDAVGRRVRLLGEMREVVGVVGDVRLFGPAARVRPTVYVPMAQRSIRTMEIVVRTAGEPQSMTSAVRETVRGIDPDQPVFGVQTMDERLRYVLVGEILMPKVAGALAGLALLLALVGVYGIMAHSVALQTRETGIRMALGAGPGDVLRAVVGQGSRLILWGTAIGLACAGVAARGLASQLFGISPFDPLVFASVSAILLSVGLIAVYLPARRATRTDPAACLRAE